MESRSDADEVENFSFISVYKHVYFDYLYLAIFQTPLK